MSPTRATSLLPLADREFQQILQKPVEVPRASKFKPIRLKLSTFDRSWDRKRGAAVRLRSIVLRDDDSALARRVCESDRTLQIYTSAAAWLQRESAYLRRMARLLDTNGGRLAAVLTRCKESAGN